MTVSISSPTQKTQQPMAYQSFWRDLKDAIRGKDRDYTVGGMNRAIVLLSVPMILEMVMESVFAVVDVYFVSRLGEEAIAVVGLTEAVMTLLFAVAIGLSMATTAMVARRIGEKRPEAARVAAFQAIVLGLLLSLPFTAVGMLFPEKILHLMGATPEVASLGRYNVMIMMGGNLTIMLLFLINAIFRGAGNAAIAMWVLWLANGINIVLDPCLIFGWGPFPELGVAGAAVATNIGRGIGVLFQIYLLFRSRSAISLRLAELGIDMTVLKRLFRVSLTGMLQWIIMTSSWIVLVRIVAVFGDDALAGYTLAIRIIIFTFLPAWGLSNATATLVGQNLGAGKPERAERSVWLCGIYTALFMLSLAVVFLLFNEELIMFFNSSPTVVAYGADCLRIISYVYLFSAFGMVMIQAFNGAGDTKTPTLVNFFAHWVLQIPLAYFLAIVLDMGPAGVFWAIVGGDFTMAVIAMALFKQGRWKKQKI